MKINQNFKLREVAGETIVVNQGVTATNLTRIISLNASARMLWEALQGKDFECKDAADLLVVQYGIDAVQAQKDALVWIESLKNCGIIAD